MERLGRREIAGFSTIEREGTRRIAKGSRARSLVSRIVRWGSVFGIWVEKLLFMGEARAGTSCNAVFVILDSPCRVHPASLEDENPQRTLTVLRLSDICTDSFSFDMQSLMGVLGCNFNRQCLVG